MILSKTTQQFIDKFWDTEIVPSLSEFIKIPCKTRTLDPDWQKNGYLQQAANLAKTWIEKQGIPGTKVQVLNLPNQSPFVFAEIPGTCTSNKTALFYGHLDKMPEAEGWDEGLSAWKPVLKGDRLYGRGAVDDGYAMFIPLTVIKSLQQQNLPYPRCVILLEASEECGSPDFMDYFNQLEKTIGDPDVIIVADAGGNDYDHLWCTTSLRGAVIGDLSVSALTKGVHSGTAGGIAPSTFRIIRSLISRLEDEKTGEIVVKDLCTTIPPERIKQAKELAQILGDEAYKTLPFIDGVTPITADVAELLLNKAWRPTLSIIGSEGLPAFSNAGNVLRPTTALRISMRLPPTVAADKAALKIKETLEKNPPYNAKVSFNTVAKFQGWNASSTAPWLEQVLTDSSLNYFGNKLAYMGEGLSIIVVQKLGDKYPNAQFMVAGITTPGSGIHGPNEFLHIPAAKKFTCGVAEVVAALAAQK